MKVIDQFVLTSAREMIEFVKTEYQVPDFDIKIRCDYSPHRRCSWGGRRNGVNFISLALFHYENARVNGSLITFNEYASFANNAVIGSVTNSDWAMALSALIAHEIAHAVCLGSIKDNVASAHGANADNHGKHGAFWKTIYRKLRVNFVNNRYLRNQFIDKHSLLELTPVTKITKIKSSNRAWFSSKEFHDGCWWIKYFRSSDKTLLGILSKNSRGEIISHKDNSQKLLTTNSLITARKLCFGI